MLFVVNVTNPLSLNTTAHSFGTAREFHIPMRFTQIRACGIIRKIRRFAAIIGSFTVATIVWLFVVRRLWQHPTFVRSQSLTL